MNTTKCICVHSFFAALPVPSATTPQGPSAIITPQGPSSTPPPDPSAAPSPVIAVKGKKDKRAQAAKSKDDDLSQGKNSLFLIFTQIKLELQYNNESNYKYNLIAIVFKTKSICVFIFTAQPGPSTDGQGKGKGKSKGKGKKDRSEEFELQEEKKKLHAAFHLQCLALKHKENILKYRNMVDLSSCSESDQSETYIDDIADKDIDFSNFIVAEPNPVQSIRDSEEPMVGMEEREEEEPDKEEREEEEREGEEQEGEESEEEESDEDDEEDDARPKRPIRKPNKKKRTAVPAADNDPKESSADAEVVEDRHKWTSTLRRVITIPFRFGLPRIRSGPTFGKLMTPVEYFFQFFPVWIFTFIADNTNINLRAKNLDATSSAEIKAWFGIRLVMGLVNINNRDDYWSNKKGFRNELIAGTMSSDRFDRLSSNLACSNPKKDPVKMPSDTTRQSQDKYNYIRSHALFYLQKVWNAVSLNCRTKYNCLRELSIDEAMIPYKGFKAWAQKFFMPCKPTRSGFKVYSLCEAASGYMANFEIHVPTAKPRKYVDIAFEVASTHLDKYHHIFTDKLYTHLDLATQLWNRNTYLTGAIKSNSARLPVDLSMSAKINKTPNLKACLDIKKTPRGTFYVRQQGNITYTLWNDSSLLTMLSTAHSGFRSAGEFVIRRYTADGDQQRTPQEVPAPPSVVAYCKSMGELTVAIN